MVTALYRKIIWREGGTRGASRLQISQFLPSKYLNGCHEPNLGGPRHHALAVHSVTIRVHDSSSMIHLWTVRKFQDATVTNIFQILNKKIAR